MTTERWERVSDIFERAASFHGVERERFIAEVCGDDAELRDELESLLEHDERASTQFMRISGNHLEAEADDGEAVGPDPIIGQRIGGCDVKSVLAAGGMGTVYLAEQESPRRDVAIKLMRVGIGGRSAARRFEYESQILAHLRHPHIAHVHAAGTHRDPAAPGRPQPYFVMEYVPDALPITEFAKKEGLSIRQRLELFLQLSDAIHHGHQKGVIHRDIKPANVLVDSGGQVKVIDFGVARATDSDLALTTMQTEMGQLMGTVQNMSPEQWNADPHAIDVRSDVYSLGVVLYELLCGKPPYDLARSPLHRAAQVIRESTPSRPGEMDRALRGDLETVILKAMEKDPTHRYQSTVELAQDVRRHLLGEPVEARPPTTWTKAHRWMCRHPRLATIWACVLLGLMTTGATIGVSVWFFSYRPYDVTLNDDRSQAILVSYTSNPLHRWPPRRGHPSRVMFAETVSQPPLLGGKHLVVIGDNQRDGVSSGTLSFYDLAGGLDTPIRSLNLLESSVPIELRKKNRHAVDFQISFAMVEDFFSGSEHPGVEIAVVFASEFSQRAIQIYDTGGELLYQVWHDGTVSSLYWMKDHGLLVFNGNNARYESNWANLGYADVEGPRAIYPYGVIALRPRVGALESEFIDCLAEPDSSDPLVPVWCRFILPEAGVRLRMHDLNQTPSRHDAGSSVTIPIGAAADPMATVTISLGPDGNELDPVDRRVVSDGYRNALDHRPDLGLPKPGEIELGTWSELLDRSPNGDIFRSKKDDAGDAKP